MKNQSQFMQKNRFGGFHFRLLSKLFISTIFLVISSSVASQTELNNIGVNVNFRNDYSSDRGFADAFRVARAWYAPGGTVLATTDSHGWPTQDAEVIVWQGIDNMQGTYKLKFTGQASSIIANWSANTITNKIYNASTNTTTADINITTVSGGGLKLTFTGTVGGIKDVKMMKPITTGSTTSYTFTDEFTNEFKAMLQKFKVVRFLNWTGTNGTNETAWGTGYPDDFYWGSAKAAGYSGYISWETIIRLANQINRDIWINIPVSATDDYITQLATLLKNTLNPNLKIYVEYSNELWNTAGPFPQSGTNKTLAETEVAAGGSSLNFDGETSAWNWAWRRVAKEGVETSMIFRSVFGNTDMMSRVRPVLMWQKRNGQSVASQCLKWLDYYSQLNSKPINYYFYGAGGSAYYSPDNASTTLTIDDIWTSLEFDVATWKTAIIKDALVATTMGLKRVAYEGGPGLDNIGLTTNGAVKIAANIDPRMKPNVINHHNTWSEQGGDLLCYFQTTGDAQWGLADDVLDLNTPKYQALNELFVAPKAAVNIGATVPFALDGKAFDINNSSATAGVGSYTLSGIDKYVGYLFRCDAGTYSFSIQYSGATNATAQYIIDGFSLGTQALNGAATTPNMLMNLSAGLHMIRVWQKSATGFTIVKANMTKVVTTPAPVIISPTSTNTFKPGQLITATGTGDNLSWSVSVVGGSVIATGTGQSVAFTVPTGAINNSQIKVQLTGGTAGTTVVSQNYTIIEDTPVIQAITTPVYVSTPATIQLTATGTGFPFIWSASNLPSGLTMTNTGLLSGTITTAATYNFNVTVTDFDGDSHTKSMSLVVSNIPNVIVLEAENYTAQSGCATSSAYGGASRNIYLDYGSMNTWGEWDVYVSAAQVYDIAVTYANGTAGSIRPTELMVNGAAVASNNFASTGSWTTWNTVTFSNVSLNALKNTLRLTASTSTGGANIDKITISKLFINAQPTINTPSNINIDANTPQTINLSGINDGDGGLHTVTVTSTSSNTALIANPTVTYTSPNATGTLAFTPVLNASGTATISVLVQDNGGTALGGVDSKTITFNVIVNPPFINAQPTINNISNITIDSNTAKTINLSGISDGDGGLHAVTITATSNNSALIANPTVTYTSPNATGILAFTPILNASGTATITVLVQDNGGTALGGVDSKTITFNVIVNPPFINTQPTINTISNISMDANTAQTINLSGISDGDGGLHAVTITATSNNTALIANPTVTYTSPNATGTLAFTPVLNASGTATITVLVQDNGGTALGGVDSKTITFNVTVNPPFMNTQPTINSVSDITISANAAQTINLGGISDGDGGLHAVTITTTSNNTALIANPTVTYTSPNATGTLSFTPSSNASGTATITVLVQDNGGTTLGGVDSKTITFNVVVNPLVLITNVTKATYVKGTNLGVNTVYYADKTYKITALPTSLVGAEFIKTMNADKTLTSTNVFSATFNASARVYIAYDSRSTTVPTWMTTLGFTKIANQQILTTDVPLNLYSANLTGTVVFGGNKAAGAGNAQTNYIVVAVVETPGALKVKKDLDNTEPIRLDLYPNPAKNNLIISADSEIAQIIISSLDGRLIYINPKVSTKEHSINVSSFSKGVYLVTVFSKNGKRTTKKLTVN